MSNGALESSLARIEDDYGEFGKAATRAARRWLDGSVPLVDIHALRTFLELAPTSLIYDSFWRTLPFGTGGRRGPVGFGPNRINASTIAMTVQGHANYLEKTLGTVDISVVVANDVREFHDIAGIYKDFWPNRANPMREITSRNMAHLAAGIYAANGVHAFLKSPDDDLAVLTTPELSFAIRSLNAAGGVNLSASHNHPDDNGIKLYNERGAQFAPPDDDILTAEMADPDLEVLLPTLDGFALEFIDDLPEIIHEEYLQMYINQYQERCRGVAQSEKLPLVYTPLCGSGLSSIGELLTRLRYDFKVPPGQGPDGTFSAIPFRAPNPEVVQSTIPAQRFAEEEKLSLVLSSDPDADRVGVDLLFKGEWVHLNGNDIAVIVTYFLMGDPDGPQLTGVVESTLVTSRLISAIAHQAGSSQVVDDLLVGFKYHANVLQNLESNGSYKSIMGSAADLVIAAEESHGISTTPAVRDKDAASAAIYIVYLHSKLHKNGRTLFDYLTEIRDQFPGFAESSRSIVLLGSEGVAQIDAIMTSLRANPLSHIAGLPVEHADDFWQVADHGPFSSNSDKIARNIVTYRAGNLVVVIRPSGTEPKIKFYASVVPSVTNELASESAAISQTTPEVLALDAATDLYRQLLQRLGRSLSDEALLLPDVATLQSKELFDRELLPEFRLRLKSNESASDILDWIAGAGEGLTPGANPLPALKQPLLKAIASWKENGSLTVTSNVDDLVRHLDAI